MEKILKGSVEFRKNDFEQHKDLFKDLSKKQKPHTLFIGCSDSRVVPNLITNTLPGEVFVIRNIANIVPMYRMSDEFLATTSAIEYAIVALKIRNIMVCGHSNCGGCASLYAPESSFAEMPNTYKWLQLASAVKEKVLSTVDPNDLAAREWVTEQTNIVEQIKHLMTYPFIRDLYIKGQLNIMGWHYIIETGEIFSYNKDLGYFELIN